MVLDGLRLWRGAGPLLVLAVAILVLAMVVPVAPAVGQPDTVRSASAEAYLDAVQSRRIQSDVLYLSVDTVSPPVEDETPPVEPERAGEPATVLGSDMMRWIVLAVVAAILVFLVALVVRNGGGVGVAFGGGVSDGSARRDKGGVAKSPRNPVPLAPGEAFLRELGAMTDRREALHRLLVRVLAQSAAMNGLRPARSWTTRDLIRSLPDEWPHLPALRRISGLAEIVWFGGRAVDRDAFEDCLDRARPIVLAPDGA